MHVNENAREIMYGNNIRGGEEKVDSLTDRYTLCFFVSIRVRMCVCSTYFTN